jgi:hypothetical protein
LVRAAILGAAAAALGAGLFWLVLTEPVTLATLIERVR